MRAEQWLRAATEFRRRTEHAPLTVLGEIAARVEGAADTETAMGRTVQRGLDRARLLRARQLQRRQRRSVRGEPVPPITDLDEDEVRRRLILSLRTDDQEGAGPSLAICVPSISYATADAQQRRLVDAAASLAGAGWRTGFYDPLAWDLMPDDVDVVLSASPDFDADLVPGHARFAVLGGQQDRPAWLADAQLPGDSSAADIAATVRAVAKSARRTDRIRLAFYPDYRSTNPYLDMLYSRAESHHVDVHPAVDPLLLAPQFQTRRDTTSVLHIHWTHAFVDQATGAADAQTRALLLADRLRRFRADGGIVVWTVHNVLPHEMVHPQAQRVVLQTIAEQADLVHVMCPATAADVAHEYHLPIDKLVVVGHSSYVGRYPDDVQRAEARRRLHLAPDARVVALVGAFRAYKGVDTLLAALDTPDVAALGVTALIAGRPKADAATEALRRAAARHKKVRLHLGFVADEDLQVYFRAADVAVFPYRRTLNSGALMAALTFGTPVIAPAQGCLPEVVSPEFGILYDPDAEDGFAAALARIDELRTPAARAAAARAGLSLTPEAMSDQFLGALRAHIDARQPRSAGS